MKKALALVLALLVLISVQSISQAQSVYNENFSIRNGLRFGMTKDEVQSAEKSTLETVTDSTSGAGLIFLCGHSEEKYNNYLYYKDITLAGYKDVYMSIGFDENETIKDITYVFNTGDAQKIFTEMRNNLTNKYDSPVFDENAPFPSESRRIASKDDTLRGVSLEFSISQYCGWLIEYKDCYVEIDLCIHKLKFNSNTNYLATIGYRLVSFQEFEELREKVEEYTQSVQNSIENDL